MNPGVLEEESDCEFEGLPQEESQDSWEACLYCSILMCHSVCDCVVWSMHMCITVQIDPADPDDAVEPHGCNQGKCVRKVKRWCVQRSLALYLAWAVV